MTEKIKYFIFNKASDFERGAADNMVYTEKGFRVSEKAGADRGRFLSRKLDSMEEDTRWHRVFLQMPPEDAGNCRVTFYCSNQDLIEDDGKMRTVDEILSDTELSFDRKTELFKPFSVKQSAGQRDILIQDISGRYLWLLIEIYGRGENTLISDITIYLPAVSWIDYLPQIYRTSDVQSGFLRRYLAIFQTLYEDMNAGIGSVTDLFDVDCADKDFLEWLGSWLDLSDTYVWKEEQLRRLLENAVTLYRMRGTKGSLSELIRLYTGERAFIIENFELERFRDFPEYEEVLVPMYGNDPYTVICLIKEQYIRERRDYNILLRIAEEMKPAQLSLRLVTLKPYIFLNRFTYLGINSVLGKYRSAAFDGQSPLTLTALTGSTETTDERS